jgi:hypothetical protein
MVQSRHVDAHGEDWEIDCHDIGDQGELTLYDDVGDVLVIYAAQRWLSLTPHHNKETDDAS